MRLLNDQLENNPKAKLKQKPVNNWTNGSGDPGLDPESFAGKSFSNESTYKLSTRIWSGYTKFIRSQCNKGRLIDSIYFGTFFKKESAEKPQQDPEKPEKITFVCIHDSKKMTEYQKPTFNAENIEAYPSNVSYIFKCFNGCYFEI